MGQKDAYKSANLSYQSWTLWDLLMDRCEERFVLAHSSNPIPDNFISLKDILGVWTFQYSANSVSYFSRPDKLHNVGNSSLFKGSFGKFSRRGSLGLDCRWLVHFISAGVKSLVVRLRISPFLSSFSGWGRLTPRFRTLFGRFKRRERIIHSLESESAHLKVRWKTHSVILHDLVRLLWLAEKIVNRQWKLPLISPSAVSSLWQSS